MNTRNKISPKTEPISAPLITSLIEVKQFTKTTHCVLPCIKLDNQASSLAYYSFWQATPTSNICLILNCSLASIVSENNELFLQAKNDVIVIYWLWDAVWSSELSKLPICVPQYICIYRASSPIKLSSLANRIWHQCDFSVWLRFKQFSITDIGNNWS